MFFVIPEMPSKTFVMLYKKLPEHFKKNSQVNDRDEECLTIIMDGCV